MAPMSGRVLHGTISVLWFSMDVSRSIQLISNKWDRPWFHLASHSRKCAFFRILADLWSMSLVKVF